MLLNVRKWLPNLELFRSQWHMKILFVCVCVSVNFVKKLFKVLYHFLDQKSDLAPLKDVQCLFYRRLEGLILFNNNSHAFPCVDIFSIDQTINYWHSDHDLATDTLWELSQRWKCTNVSMTCILLTRQREQSCPSVSTCFDGCMNFSFCAFGRPFPMIFDHSTVNSKSFVFWLNFSASKEIRWY